MTRLRDIMTLDVVTVGAESTLREAIGILRAENVTGAPVLHGSKVVGVMSVADILDFEVETPAVPVERAGRVEDEDVESFYSDLWDDAGAEVAERFAHDVGPEWDLLSEHVVSEVMTQTLYALPPDTELAPAAEYMTQRGIHRVLVMEGGRLLGIVTSSDFVRAVSERRV